MAFLLQNTNYFRKQQNISEGCTHTHCTPPLDTPLMNLSWQGHMSLSLQHRVIYCNTKNPPFFPQAVCGTCTSFIVCLKSLQMVRLNNNIFLLQWGSKAFKNMTIVPPGSGIVHQVNLEYLGRVVFNMNNVLYPDSVVGTDSHTTMINGLGIVGWGK